MALFDSKSKKYLRTLAVTLVLCALLTACGDDEGQVADDNILPENDTFTTLPPQEQTAPLFEATPELTPPNLAIFPAQVEFPPTLEGTTRDRRITLTNTGEDFLEIREISLSNPDDFTTGGSCLEADLPLSLEQNESCQVDITFNAPAGLNELDAGNDITSDIIIITNMLDKSVSNLSVSARVSLPEPEPEPVVVAPTPVAPPVQIVEKRTPPFQVLNALEINQQRKQASAFVGSVEQSGPDGESTFLKNTDIDYAGIGFDNNVSSLPVNRSLMITADRFIPAVLETTINNRVDTPRVTAVIEQNVYSGDGRFVLLPAGSRMIGSVGSTGSFNLPRVSVSWNRIIRPDGVGIAIDGVSTDPSGQNGLVGAIDYNLERNIGIPLLVSVIEGVAEIATAGSGEVITTDEGDVSEVQDATSTAIEDTTEEIGDLVQDFVEKFEDDEPLIIVPGGTRFQVILQTDVFFASPTLITSTDLRGELTDYAKTEGRPLAISALERRGILQPETQRGNRGSGNGANQDLPSQSRDPNITPSSRANFVIEPEQPPTVQEGLPPPSINR